MISQHRNDRNSTEIAYQSLESTTAHQDKTTHLVIYINSTVRNALSEVFQETWVLHSIPLGRGFVFLVRTQIFLLALAVTLLLQERLESHLSHGGRLAAVIKNVATSA